MNIVLGVSGGIAAFKAVTLARLFVEHGHDVHVVPTRDALKFVGLPTWEAISRNPVTTSVHEHVPEVRHVALGQQADLIVVAPATANTLAKMAAGIADDLLGTTLLASTAPVLVAPAMHTEMWQHPATRENVATLAARGVHFIGPESGRLTGTDSGPGRMSEPQHIFDRAIALISEVSQRPVPLSREDGLSTAQDSHNLNGVQVVITAGGTREPIDPVRFIGNKSSGKQGIALAIAAQQRGAQVTVIAANVDDSVIATLSDHVTVQRVSTAEELESAVVLAAQQADVVIMAAAVADYRVSEVSAAKIRKEDHPNAPLHLQLETTTDILRLLVEKQHPGQIIVGFAAETLDSEGEAADAELLERGLRKLERKQCDLLAVNHVGWQRGFETDENQLLILNRSGDIVDRAEGSKLAVAQRLVDAIIAIHKPSAA